MNPNFLRILCAVSLIFSSFNILYAAKRRYVQIITFREEGEEKFINFYELSGKKILYDKSDEICKEKFIEALESSEEWGNRYLPEFEEREIKDTARVASVIYQLLRKEADAIFIIDRTPLRILKNIWETLCEIYKKEKKRLRLELIPIPKDIIDEMNIQTNGYFSFGSIKSTTYFTYEDIRTARIVPPAIDRKTLFKPYFGFSYIQKTGQIFVYPPGNEDFSEPPPHPTFRLGAEYIKILSKGILLSGNLNFNFKTEVELINSLTSEKVKADTYPNLSLVINGGYNIIKSENFLLYPFVGSGIHYLFGKSKEYTSDQGNLIKIDPSRRKTNLILNGGIGFNSFPSESRKLELHVRLTYFYIFIEKIQRGIAFSIFFLF